MAEAREPVEDEAHGNGNYKEPQERVEDLVAVPEVHLVIDIEGERRGYEEANRCEQQ